MPFFRQFQHLLPRGKAWDLTQNKTLRKFFVGLSGVAEDIRAVFDANWYECFPGTTTLLDEWENQFGLQANPIEATRRLNLAAEWASGGGQSPRYIQDVLQTAGFNVYIHDWWSSGPGPYVARDPRSYTTVPLNGTVQCAPSASAPACKATDLDPHRCNAFLANEPGYIVNLDLNNNAPPSVPSDQTKWPHFLYLGAETFPEFAAVPVARRAEFERLLLKLCPAQDWIVTLVTYFYETFDDTFDPSFP